jgi:hypothetical protein
MISYALSHAYLMPFLDTFATSEKHHFHSANSAHVNAELLQTGGNYIFSTQS